MTFLNQARRNGAAADLAAADLDALTGDSGDSGDSGDNRDTCAKTDSALSPVADRGPGTPGTGFKVDERGVWFEPLDGPDKGPQWISSPLHVTAMTRDVNGESWGRLLEFRDPDDRPHRWACPLEMLAGDSTDFRRALLSMGLQIAPGAKARQLLSTYVQTSRTEARAVCTGRTGWHGECYVLPDETLGEDGERVLLQTFGEPPKMRTAGTPQAWRDGVGALCVGNSRLVLAVSAAFAAPLLELVGDEGGGIHLAGASSTGKTTALRLAASVWGGPEYLHRWRATANGLEAVATGHNDALLVLDELAQVDPREAGEIAYMLANGSGKHRARRDGLARRAALWRLLFLSAGEVGLADHMAAIGKRSRAGQEVRLVDVPADAGVGNGIFEELHGHAGGAGIADAIARACRAAYGVPARAYLEALVRSPRELLVRDLERLRSDFVAAAVPRNADGQAQRVAARFGIVAAGGELATRLGLTGWPRGEAVRATANCYRAWLSRRGGAGSQEDAAALSQVRHFLEAHGASRFQDLDVSRERPIPNRAGYRRRTTRGIEYMVLPEVFKREVCTGLDYRAVGQALRRRGLLITEGADRLTLKPRDIGRVYVVLDPAHHEDQANAE